MKKGRRFAIADIHGNNRALLQVLHRCNFDYENDTLICLGDVVDGEMRLNGAGHIVDKSWQQIVTHFTGVNIDQYIIMPNHFHGIITAVGAGNIGADCWLF